MEFDLLSPIYFSTPLVGALILGALSPIAGMFLVIRRFSLLADTLAHVSLLGVALGLVWQVPFSLGAMSAAVLGGWGIEMLRQTRKILSEATLAVFLSGSLSIALILFAWQDLDGEEIEGYLFGNLSSVGLFDVEILFLIAVAVAIFFLRNYRRLFVIALDEDLARVAGVSVRWINSIFMLLASLVVAVAIKVVGVLLVSALFVLPVLASMQWQLSFRKTLFLGIGISEMAVLIGYSLAFFLQWPSGATIALMSLGAFIFSYTVHLRWRK